jgi:hypothetical protein
VRTRSRILGLLKLSNNRTLSILEQAAFIAELKNVRRLNVAEIAAELSRSKSWVTMRLGLMAEMSAKVRQQLFTGAFTRSTGTRANLAAKPAPCTVPLAESG